MSNDTRSRPYEKSAATIRAELADALEERTLTLADRKEITTTTEGLLCAAVLALRSEGIASAALACGCSSRWPEHEQRSPGDARVCRLDHVCHEAPWNIWDPAHTAIIAVFYACGTCQRVMRVPSSEQHDDVRLLREMSDACRRAGTCPTCGADTDADGMARK